MLPKVTLTGLKFRQSAGEKKLLTSLRIEKLRFYDASFCSLRIASLALHLTYVKSHQIPHTNYLLFSTLLLSSFLFFSSLHISEWPRCPSSIYSRCGWSHHTRGHSPLPDGNSRGCGQPGNTHQWCTWLESNQLDRNLIMRCRVPSIENVISEIWWFGSTEYSPHNHRNDP